MNTHRIALEVGQRHFNQNPVGALHRAVSQPSITGWRRRCAADATEHAVYGSANEVLGDGTPRTTPCLVAWRVAVGASKATHALRKVDHAIDSAFGSCFAQRAAGRPGWESEGFLAQIGKVPLHGLALAGAKLGGAYATVTKGEPREAAARGARIGAILGGALAFLWSQGLAVVGFAAKMVLRVPTAAYLTAVQAFEPMDKELAQDAFLGTASRYNPLRVFSKT